MKNKTIIFFIACLAPIFVHAAIHIGASKVEITPPIGTPSAGYLDRNGEGMEGILDPLYAIALVLDNGEKKIALCSVDNLGFTYEMVQEVTALVHADKTLSNLELYVASSHTHSGGGGYLNIPYIGESLAGLFSPKTKNEYVAKTAQAIIQASQNLVPGKLGIGFGPIGEISVYRASWPENVTPPSTLTLLKMTRLDGTPLAALFNYPLHPTVLKSNNRLFSADFVGVARNQISALIGGHVQAIYFNGAQGDIVPNPSLDCLSIGNAIAVTVKEIWDQTEVSDTLDLLTEKLTYSFKPETTPFGLKLPVDEYHSEMNLLVLNKKHAFLTIPGELSCVYDTLLKEYGLGQTFDSVSFFGLTNDAHGYIVTPESWSHKTFESKLSFAGENYGKITFERAKQLLKDNRPEQRPDF